jgi:hypothetical protein
MSAMTTRLSRREFVKVASATALCGVIGSISSSRVMAAPHWPQGPAGGPGGRPFQTDWVQPDAHILSIEIREGRRIDAIQIHYEFSDGRRSHTPRYGGGGGQLSTYVFDRGEWLIGIEGTVGRGSKDTDRITSLTLLTSQGHSIQYGRGGGYYFRFMAPHGAEVIGLIGRYGRELDAIGVMLRQRT